MGMLAAATSVLLHHDINVASASAQAARNHQFHGINPGRVCGKPHPGIATIAVLEESITGRGYIAAAHRALAGRILTGV
jgi:hypothetical protein